MVDMMLSSIWMMRRLVLAGLAVRAAPASSWPVVGASIHIEGLPYLSGT
ncbi:MAG: hypothetical protein JF591_11800 [Lysobacter sp.]|nr:hypothetical protein [Lysobacter sp.]